MKKVVVNLYIICLLAVAVAACSSPENGKTPLRNASDTVYSEKAILNIYGSDPQRALTMIDSSLLVGNIDEDRATLLRARVYCYSPDEWPLDTVNQMLEGLLESDFAQKNPDNRQAVLDLLVYASRRRSDNVAYLRWATEKADFCHQQGEETEALRTEAEIGTILTSMGEVEKGLSKLDGVIGALDKQRHFNEMDACIIALKRKIYVLFEVERSNEVPPLAKRMVERLNDYRTHPDDYDDGSFRLPSNEEKRLDYCNFYISQAYSYLMIAYADLKQSDIQAVKQSYADSARYYLTLFLKSDYSNTLVGKMMLASAYLRLGQYGKVKPLYDEIEACMGADTLNSDYAILLRGRAIMAEAAGNYYAANSYGKRYNNLKELLNKQLLESRAYEYAARYHEQEQQLALEQEQAAKKRMGMVVVSLGILTLLAIVSIVIILRQLRDIRKKNAVLSKEISERIGYEEKYISSMHNTDIQNSEFKTQNSNADLSACSDRELFDYIRKVVSEENLHLDPQFGRDQLVERLQLSKERIGAAFAQGSEYGNISNFLNEARLFHSTKLLTEHPEMPIAEVAAASGFSNRVVFSRNFKERFAMTPSEFREKN